MMWVDLNKTTAAVNKYVIERERIINVDSLHVPCTLYSSIIQKENVLDMYIVCMYTVQLDYIEIECTRHVDSLYVHCKA